MGIKKKIYEDYFKPSRLDKYEGILLYAKQNGYCMVGVQEFYDIVNNGTLNGTKKYLLNRHDIDTSPKVAREMFEIERKIYGENGSSTFYFRDTTADVNLIRYIESYGYETGYHYETIANYEKKRKAKNRAMLQTEREELEKRFLCELDSYRRKTKTLSRTIASHGDFVNVMLDIPNYWLLESDSLRGDSGIVVEAYDEKIMKYVQKRLADHVLGVSFADEVNKAIQEEIPVIMILTHPRNWKRDVIDNTRENFRRLIQGVLYKI